MYVLILNRPRNFIKFSLPDLSDDQRDKLEARLKMETEEIVKHFGHLVCKTMPALKNKGVTIDELISVIRHSYARNGNKLIDQLEEVTILSKTFRVLATSLLVIF